MGKAYSFKLKALMLTSLVVSACTTAGEDEPANLCAGVTCEDKRECVGNTAIFLAASCEPDSGQCVYESPIQSECRDDQICVEGLCEGAATDDASDASDQSDPSDVSDTTDASDATDSSDQTDASDPSDTSDASDATDASDTTDPSAPDCVVEDCAAGETIECRGLDRVSLTNGRCENDVCVYDEAIIETCAESTTVCLEDGSGTETQSGGRCDETLGCVFDDAPTVTTCGANEACSDGACALLPFCDRDGACSEPPASACSGDVLVTYTSGTGSCNAETESCDYSDLMVTTNCAAAGQYCDETLTACATQCPETCPSLASRCEGNTFVAFSGGSCDDARAGSCSESSYTRTEEACGDLSCDDTLGCLDLCDGIVCDTPPLDSCSDDTATQYQSDGVCIMVEGAPACDYISFDVTCDATEFCIEGRCEHDTIYCDSLSCEAENRSCVEGGADNGLDAVCGACVGGFIESDVSGECRAVADCDAVGCGSSTNRVCTFDAGGNLDATCGECQEGYQEATDGTCEPIPTFDCRVAGSADQASCGALSRQCSPATGLCGSCIEADDDLDGVNDYYRPDGAEACEFRTSCSECEAERRVCVTPTGESQDSACGGCEVGYTEPVSGVTTSCVEVGQECVNEPGTFYSSLANDCIDCSLGGCGIEGQTGECSDYGVCYLASGYYSEEGEGGSPKACDQDGDGWINETANRVSPSERGPLTYMCDEQIVSEVALVNDSGETRVVTLSTPIVFVESDELDSDATLRDIAMKIPGAIASGDDASDPAAGQGESSTERMVKASQLNPLTKLCWSVDSDFNDDGRPDYRHAPYALPLTGDTATTDNSETGRANVYSALSYFAELHTSYFDPVIEGRYVIAERVRPGDEEYPRTNTTGVAPLAMGYQSWASGPKALASDGYWNTCKRQRDPRFIEDPEQANLDFAQFSSDSVSGFVMGHHSQFRCLPLAMNSTPTGGLEITDYAAPDSDTGTDADFWNSNADRYHFNRCGIEVESDGKATVALDRNGSPDEMAFRCSSTDTVVGTNVRVGYGSHSTFTIADIPGPLAWFSVGYRDYASAENALKLIGDTYIAAREAGEAQEEYRGGCVNEAEALTEAQKASTCGVSENSPRVRYDAAVFEFGKLQCGCGYGYATSSDGRCTVGCPTTSLTSDGFNIANRAEPTDTPCDTNAECAANAVCDTSLGVCVTQHIWACGSMVATSQSDAGGTVPYLSATLGAAQGCTEGDGECGLLEGNFQCISGQCVESCQSSADCRVGYRCDEDILQCIADIKLHGRVSTSASGTVTTSGCTDDDPDTVCIKVHSSIGTSSF